jgi:hypothetical protein
MILVYNIKTYSPPPLLWLKHEEWFIDAGNARRAARDESHFVLTMYEVDEPLNPVALLNRVACFRRFEVIEDTRGLVQALSKMVLP